MCGVCGQSFKSERGVKVHHTKKHEDLGPECVAQGCTALRSAHLNWSRYCGAHLERLRKHGDVLAHVPLGRLGHLGNATGDVCRVPGCDRERQKTALGRRSLCSTHQSRLANHGDVLADVPKTRQYGRDRDASDWCDYYTAHTRIRSVRGPASGYTCECGAPAEQWAYQHAAEHEFSGTINRGKREIFVRWSGDPDDYAPMCRSCHGKLDRKQTEAVRG